MASQEDGTGSWPLAVRLEWQAGATLHPLLAADQRMSEIHPSVALQLLAVGWPHCPPLSLVFTVTEPWLLRDSR